MITPKIDSYVIKALQIFRGVFQGSMSILGFVVVLLGDSVLGVIIYPIAWPGIANRTFPIFGWDMSTQGLAFTYSFATGAIQVALWRRVIKAIKNKQNPFRSFWDVAGFLVALFFATTDTAFDGFAGSVMTGEWYLLLSSGWAPLNWLTKVMIIIFGVFSAIGEPAADIILEQLGDD